MKKNQFDIKESFEGGSTPIIISDASSILIFLTSEKRFPLVFVCIFVFFLGKHDFTHVKNHDNIKSTINNGVMKG